MKNIRITKRFSFEMAHALTHYNGLCKNIHGHSYYLDVTVKGTVLDNKNSPQNGMVMDFAELKKIVEELIIHKMDHALVLSASYNSALIKSLRENFEKIILLNYQPTTENMLIDFAEKINEKLPKHILLYSIRMSETDTSYAEWFAEDNL